MASGVQGAGRGAAREPKLRVHSEGLSSSTPISLTHGKGFTSGPTAQRPPVAQSSPQPRQGPGHPSPACNPKAQHSRLCWGPSAPHSLMLPKPSLPCPSASSNSFYILDPSLTLPLSYLHFTSQHPSGCSPIQSPTDLPHHTPCLALPAPAPLPEGLMGTSSPCSGS